MRQPGLATNWFWNSVYFDFDNKMKYKQTGRNYMQVMWPSWPTLTNLFCFFYSSKSHAHTTIDKKKRKRITRLDISRHSVSYDRKICDLVVCLQSPGHDHAPPRYLSHHCQLLCCLFVVNLPFSLASSCLRFKFLLLSFLFNQQQGHSWRTLLTLVFC